MLDVVDSSHPPHVVPASQKKCNWSLLVHLKEVSVGILKIFFCKVCSIDLVVNVDNGSLIVLSGLLKVVHLHHDLTDVGQTDTLLAVLLVKPVIDVVRI